MTLSPGEIERKVEHIERRQIDFVLKELYERDLREISGDIREIKESQKWMSRLVIAQFVTLIVSLVVVGLTSGVSLG